VNSCYTFKYEYQTIINVIKIIKMRLLKKKANQINKINQTRTIKKSLSESNS